MKQPGTDYRYVVMQSAAVATGNGTAVTCTSTENGALSSLTMQVVIVTTATITFEGTIDGTNWIAILATNLTSAAAATTATASGLYRCTVTGLIQARARISGWTSGAVTVTGVLTV